MLRLRRLVFGTVIVALLSVAGAIAATGARSYESNDFFCLWSGARIVLQGDSPYDQAAWAAATGGLHPGHDGTPGPSACTTRFAYPLWTAFALIPVGALPLGAAAIVWMALAIAGTIAGTVGAWRAFGGPAAAAPVLAALVVASQPFWLLLVGGQITGLLLGLAGLACAALVRDRQLLTGTLLGALILKPQLVMLTLPVTTLAAASAGRRRLVAGISGTVAVLIGGAFVHEPGWSGPWLAELGDRTQALTPHLATLWGLADDLFGSALWAIPLIVGCGIGAVFIVRDRVIGPATWLALLIPWSLAAAPHAWSYDHLLLVVPWAATLAYATRMRRRERTAILLALVGAASLLPWLLYAVAFARGRETLSAVIPVVSLCVVAIAARATSPAQLDAISPRSGPGSPGSRWWPRR